MYPKCHVSSNTFKVQCVIFVENFVVSKVAKRTNCFKECVFINTSSPSPKKQKERHLSSVLATVLRKRGASGGVTVRNTGPLNRTYLDL